MVQQGESMGALIAEDAGFLQGYQSYWERVRMGYSIGVEAKGGGTLEGYINLIDPNDAANKNTVFLNDLACGTRLGS